MKQEAATTQVSQHSTGYDAMCRVLIAISFGLLLMCVWLVFAPHAHAIASDPAFEAKLTQVLAENEATNAQEPAPVSPPASIQPLPSFPSARSASEPQKETRLRGDVEEADAELSNAKPDAAAQTAALKAIEAEVAGQLEALGAGDRIRASITSNVLKSHVSKLDGDFTVEVTEHNDHSLRWDANLLLSSQKSQQKPIAISGRYESLVDVPVLKNRLMADQEIKAEDIEWIAYPQHRLKKDTVLNEKDLIGKAPKRSIANARPLRTAEISAPVMIHKGVLVHIFYSVPGMEIRTLGEALDDAAMGETVRIRNTNSNIVIQATVTGASTATVDQTTQLPPRLASLH